MLTNFKLNEIPGQFLLVGQVGSKSYGTSTPESDDDWMGIALAPKSCYFGLDSWEKEGSLKIDLKETDNAELTAYELKKFLRLMLNFNPNVVPLLYLRDEDYAIKTVFGQFLIDNRWMFESKRAHLTLIGYAKAQVHSVVNVNTGKLGQKRKELVAKYGYDVKFASHTIRILNMAIEFFRTGKLNVYRTWDKDILMSIRNGEWSLDKWLSETKTLITWAEQAAESSTLPEEPHYAGVNGLCSMIIQGSMYNPT